MVHEFPGGISMISGCGLSYAVQKCAQIVNAAREKGRHAVALVEREEERAEGRDEHRAQHKPTVHGEDHAKPYALLELYGEISENIYI